MTTTVVLLPRDAEQVVRTCGHQHREEATAERCLNRARRRWPQIGDRIVLADSLIRAEWRREKEAS